MEQNVGENSLNQNSSSDYILLEQKLPTNELLLNTFIYLYLANYFENVEFCLNEDKVKDIFTNEIFEKVKILNDIEKNNENVIEKNRVLRNEKNGIKDEEDFQKAIFTYVEKIVVDIFLLQSTKEQLEFPYVLVKVKIEINVNISFAKIKSLEYTLIKKNWRFLLNEVFDKKTFEEKENAQLIIYFKKGVTEEDQKKVQLFLINSIHMHSLFCETGYDDTKVFISEVYNHNNVTNNFVDKREEEILKREIGIKEKNINKDIYKLKEEINHLLFSLFEPAFYNVSLDKKNKICYKKMYDLFKKIMIRSKTLKMNKELIAYLLCDSIFLPPYVKKNTFRNVDEDAYSSLDSYSSDSLKKGKSTEVEEVIKPGEKNEKNGKNGKNEQGERKETEEHKKNQKDREITEENCSSGEVTSYEISDDSFTTNNVETNQTSEKKRKKKTMKDLFENVHFRKIVENIKNIIEELNNSVFLRVNSKSLKSGSFVNDYNLEVKTQYDALLMLKSATSVYKVLQRNKKTENYLIFSKYVNINICCLFEAYVYNNELIALSQKYINHYFSFLNDPIAIIDTINLIKTFFETNLKDSFFCPNYTCQLYMHSFKKTNKKKIVLINAKSWICKNTHPVLTNEFLKQYIYTGEKGTEVRDDTFNKHNVFKFQLNPITDKKEETEKKADEKKKKKDEHFDFYFYDGILFFSINQDNTIYKKNDNIYPKDMSYVREGEIDIDKLMDTMKKENNIQ